MTMAFALWRGLSPRVASISSQLRLFATEFSQRGKDAVSLLPNYLADARAVQKYSPTTPQGALQLSVAENQMLEDLLVPVLSDLGSSVFAPDCIYYQPTQGRESLRVAIASYLQRLLGLTKPLQIDNLVVGAGCNAVLENLCFCLTQPGDAVLIPTPYYAAFEFDLVARAGLSIVAVSNLQHYAGPLSGSIPPAAYYPTPVALEAAYNQACSSGHPPRILLLSHPQNPLGICYPASVVLDCIDWCRSREIHLISDEIYAGSVYREVDSSYQANNDVVPFVSSLALCDREYKSTITSSTPHTTSKDLGLGLGPFVHLVYALSKDFGLSGLRVGACYTENNDILLPLQKLNDLCQISSQTQVLVEAMLTKQDDEGVFWTDSFLQQNQKRIRQRGDALEAVLTECCIPFLKASAGLFLWIDLSEFLPLTGSSEEREKTLYVRLLEYGLLFTPGLSMRHEQPGYFRCVFTAAGDDEFGLSLDRIRRFIQQERDQNYKS